MCKNASWCRDLPACEARMLGMTISCCDPALTPPPPSPATHPSDAQTTTTKKEKKKTPETQQRYVERAGRRVLVSEDGIIGRGDHAGFIPHMVDGLRLLCACLHVCVCVHISRQNKQQQHDDDDEDNVRWRLIPSSC